MKREHVLLTISLLLAMTILPTQVTSHAQVNMPIPDRVWHEDMNGYQFREPTGKQDWGECIVFVDRNI